MTLTFEPILRLVEAAKSFGMTTALDGLTLEAGKGEIVSLVGPSGCGKTTALRAIAGLETLDSGMVMIDDLDCKGLPPGRRGVGYVFQEYALFPHLTVRQNIAFGLRHLSKEAKADRVREVMDLVGISALDQRYPRQLSGGQQQRVALARSLAPKPKILLLDEPFSNVDPQLRRRVRHELIEIIRNSQAATLWVTHDHDEGLLVADRVVVMKDGKARQVGTPSEIWRRPADSWVAGFMGTGDLIDGIAVDEAIETKLGTLEAGGLPDGTRVKVLVQPGDLKMDPSGAEARVLRKHFDGSDNIYCLEIERGGLLHFRQPGHVEIERGSTLRVRLENETLPFFVEQGQGT